MDIQIIAGFKKEILAFLRSHKLLILACVFIGLSVFSPLMIKGMSLLMDAMSDTYDSLGVDVSGISGELSSSALLSASSLVSDLSTTGLLVYLLVINTFAGGEQKQRSIIIPQISGLGSSAYILPKFIIYPITVFVITLLGSLVGGIVSTIIFDVNDIVWPALVAAGSVVGIYNMLYVCLHLALGIGTGKAGMSSAICIVASFLLPNFLSLMETTPTFNPFTMNLTAVSVLYGYEKPSNILIAAAITLAVTVVAYFITLFALNAKKIDNSGNEILI